MSVDVEPQPPVLIVRPRMAFWVVHDSVRRARATLQAFREGCFDGALCYDASGGSWDVTGAALDRPPTIIQRILLHRRLPVTLELGPRRAADLDDLVQGDLATTIDNFGTNPGEVDDASEWYELKVVVSGTSIKCYVDDVLKFDITDSTYSVGTAGLWTWSETDCEFDNMTVE